MKKIPIFKPLLPTHDQLAPYLAKIDHTRWYSNYGPLVQQLEQRFIQHYSSHASPDVSKSLPHVVSVSNATVGLTLTLQALDLPKNSYCIVPSWTFVASALAIQNAGLTPLFVDIDPQTWCPNPDLVRELVQHHGAQISSLMVVVPFGAPIHTQMWEKLAQSLNIQLIFDAAAAFDTWKLTDSPAVLSLHGQRQTHGNAQ